MYSEMLRVETKLRHTGTDGVILKRILHKYEYGLDLYETGERQIFVCCNPKLGHTGTDGVILKKDVT